MKELNKLFERLIASESSYKVFNELLDYLLFSMCIGHHPEYELKNPFTDCKDEKLMLAMEFYKAMGEEAEGFEDPLGEIFMEHITKGQNGQFFTPMHICKMMAAMTMDRTDPDSQETLNDPACGSARMFLAAASFNRNLEFNGADIDLTCCKMATINMLLNSLKATISWGDSLLNKFQFAFVTNVTEDKIPYLKFLKYDIPNKPEIVHPELPKNPVVIQGTLF